MGDSLVSDDRRPIGDLTVGPLAFGCWRFTDPDVGRSRHLVETALDAGLDLVDTADVYGLDFGGEGFGHAEEILGRVLADAPGLRDRMVLATKGGIRPPVPYDSSPRYLVEACEASLRRLGIDVIDLYQIHRPDIYTHPAEVAEALDRLRDDGKILHVGVSNHTPEQYEALAVHLPFPIATIQPEMSALHLEPLHDGTLDRAMRDDVTPLAWSALGGGRLATGDGVRRELLEVLDSLAEREGVDRAAVATAFVLAHPSRPVVIVGSQNPERVSGSVAALRVHLDRGDVYDIIEASQGVPLP